MKQAWIGGSKDDIAPGYICPQGGASDWVASAGFNSQLISAPGTIDRLFLKLEVAPGAGDSRTFTLYKNGSPSSLTATISDTDTTGSDLSNSVSVVAGDEITLRSELSGSPAAGRAQWTMMFSSTNTYESNLLGACVMNSSTTAYTGAMDAYRSTEGTENNVRQVCPLDGKIKNLYVKLSSDPGTAPDAYRITLRVNGASSTLTTTITANDTTGNDTTHEVDVVAGDILTVMFEPLNGPTVSPRAFFGMTFLAEVDGLSPVMGGSSGAPSTISLRYGRVSNTADTSFGWNATENINESMISECTLSDLYVLLAGSPGSGNSYTYSLRKNQADPASGLSVTISDAATTGNDTTNTIDYVDEDAISIKVVPVSGPTSTDSYWGFVMEISEAIVEKTLSAVINASGSVARKTGKGISATVNVAGSVARSVAKALASTVNISGAVLRSVSKSLTSTVNISVALTKVETFVKALAAVVNTSATVARDVGKTVSATINASGSVGRKMAKDLASIVNVDGSLEKMKIVYKSILATVNISGTVARAIAGKIYEGGVQVVGSVGRVINKSLVAVVNASGSLTKTKVFNKALAATINISGTVSRGIAKSLVSTINISGTAGRFIAKALAATVNIVGSVIPQTAIPKHIIAAVNATGSVARTAGKGIVGLVNATGSVARAIAKSMVGTVNISGSVARMKIVYKVLAATINVSGSAVRSAGKSLLAAVNVAGDVSERHIAKGIIAVVNVSGIVGRAMTRVISAVVNISGTVVRAPSKIVGGGLQVAGSVGRVIHKHLVATVNAGATVAREVYDMAYEMNKTIRQIFGRVRITYSDPFFSAGIEAEATETGRFTYPAQTVDNVEEEAYKWFSLHRNTLDGTFHPLPSNQEFSVGWWGATLSHATTAAFAPGTQTLTITHAARTIESLLVVGDDKLNEYPVAFTVKLYTEGDVLVHTETVPANAVVRWSKDLSPTHEGVVKQVLDITEWSRVSSVAKIAQFFTMLEETYDSEDGELFSIRVLEEREFTEPTIPQGNISSNAITVRLNNIDYLFTDGNYHSRLSGLLLNNRAIKAWLGCDSHTGQRIWFPLGTFYSRDWKAPEGETWAEVGGYDMLDRLKQTEFSTSEVYEDVTLHDLAITVMTDAGLTDEDWEIDATLDTVDYTVPYAWFNRISHREALRKIAAAALGQVYCNRDGKVVIEVYVAPAAQPYDFEFDEANFFEVDHPLEWSQMINSVDAKASPRVASALQDICLDTETFTVPTGDSVTKTHIFDVSPCVDVVDTPGTWVFTNPGGNVTCTAVTTYAWGCVATYENGNGGDETVTSVTIQGKPLEVQGGRTVTSEDDDSIAQNGRQTLSTPITSEFWQGETKAQAVADALLASYKDPRRDVIMKARGNIALLLGDRVVAPDFSDEVTSEYNLMRQDIKFDGGMDVAITGQRIIGGHTIYKKSIVATLNVAGSIDAEPNHHTGGVELSGSVARVIHKPLVATINMSGDITGPTVRKGLVAEVNVAGAVNRGLVFNKSLTGIVNVDGAAGRESSFSIGSEPINRATRTGSDRTFIDLALPAIRTDSIISVDIYLATTGGDATGWKVGTFHGSGTDYTCRDFAALPELFVGLNNITSLSIDVEVGDFIGVYIPNLHGEIELDTSGGSDVRYKAGDQTASGLQTYTLVGSGWSISVRGTSDVGS